MSKCWIWTGAKDTNGYGQFNVRNKHLWAHQASYALFNGPVGQLHVLHKCDVRSCFNPKHLYLGTHTENMKDRSVRGRTRNGARLTHKAVRYIRAALKKGTPPKDLSIKWNINLSQIYRIKHGQVWKEIKKQKSYGKKFFKRKII